MTYTPTILAITLQLVLFLYHQVTTRCDFFPFNGIRFYTPRERQLEAGFNLVFMAFPPIGFIFRIPFLMGAGVGYYFILLALEIATWWLPYFFGPSPKWLELYTRMHSQTISVLPRRGTNPRPNLEHLILMVLTLLAGISTLTAYQRIEGGLHRYWWLVSLIGVILVTGTISQSCAPRRKTPSTPNT